MLFFSPAKINLFFRVLRKRSDGYHEIASLFQAIDLFDLIFISKDVEDSLTCSDPSLLCGHDNLVVKALHVFRKYFPFSHGVKIHLEKKIPMQSGLGGGSGNAATTLWALNELTGRRAKLHELITMGEKIGSDVPFFFSQGTAYCTGRGEHLESFDLPHPLEGWIAKPSFGLSTPCVYRETRVEELSLQDPRDSLREYPRFYNDLESAAIRLEPRLQDFRSKLKQMGFETVTMTGSGTAFFCTGGCSNISSQIESDLPLIPFRSIQRSDASWYEMKRHSQK